MALKVAKTEFGGLDILVNNAGWTYRRKETLEVSDDEYDRMTCPCQKSCS